MSYWRRTAMVFAGRIDQRPECGEEMDGDRPAQDTHDAPRSYCLLAMQELGLVPHAADDTIRATIDSYYRLGLIPAEAAESVGCDRLVKHSVNRHSGSLAA